MDLEKIGKKLKQHRLEKGYNLRDVGKITDMDYSYIGKLENGKVKNPTLKSFEKLCELYGISEVELFGGEEVILSDELKELGVEWISHMKEEGITPADLKRYANIIKELKNLS